jgi:hypothetical protein
MEHKERRCGTFLEETSIDLGFSPWSEFIGGWAMLEGTRGAHTRWWRGQGWTHATRWCGHLLVVLHLCFGLRLVSEKIGTSGFILSNSENISCNFSKTQKL